MHLTARGPVPGAPEYRVTWATSEDQSSGFYNPSAGLFDYYASATKALGFTVASSNPKIIGYTGHLVLDTDTDSKQVRINSRNFTQASGDSMGFQTTPNQTVTTTGEIFGGQIKPRAAASIGCGGVNGLGIDVEMKDGTANNSGDMRGLNIYLGALGSGTISGDIVGIRLRLEAAKTVSGDIVALEVEDNEAADDWTHLLKVNAALGTHGMTTNSDKTGNTKSGTLKVKAGSTLYHIQLYADS